MSVNRVISCCFCVSCETPPFFLSASNQSPSPFPLSGFLPPLFSVGKSLFFPPSGPPYEVRGGRWWWWWWRGCRKEKERGRVSEIQREMRNESIKKRKSSSSVFFFLFFKTCLTVVQAAWGLLFRTHGSPPDGSPPGTVGAAQGRRGLWENLCLTSYRQHVSKWCLL